MHHAKLAIRVAAKSSAPKRRLKSGIFGAGTKNLANPWSGTRDDDWRNFSAYEAFSA
jgi:hypothetical protein